MRTSDVKKGHIYFANLEPTDRKKYEFGGQHLCIVLNVGEDNKTFTVIPLTSDAMGIGVNKIDLGVLSGLPTFLKQDGNGNPIHSFAVLDNVRTIAASRMFYIKDGVDASGNPNYLDNCKVDFSTFNAVLKALLKRQFNFMDKAELLIYQKEVLENSLSETIVNLSYSIINNRGDLNSLYVQLEANLILLKSLNPLITFEHLVKDEPKKTELIDVYKKFEEKLTKA